MSSTKEYVPGPDERIVRVNGVDICVDTAGDPADPAILLISGLGSSMDWWEADFCEQVASAPRYVVRYDARDTGRSVSYPTGSPGYSQSDLAADALGVLDALELDRAHLVGVSMGGGIAQRIVVEHPERVATVTLVATTPGGPGGPAHPDLPPMAEHVRAMFAAPGEVPDPDWTDRDAVIQHFVDGERPFAGTYGVDEARVRQVAARTFDRTVNLASSMQNHWLMDSGEPVRHRLGQVTVPTLVLHGTEDPLFPYGHGEALAAEIPGARLVPLEGVGHQMPPRPVWNVFVGSILAHTEPGKR